MSREISDIRMAHFEKWADSCAGGATLDPTAVGRFKAFAKSALQGHKGKIDHEVMGEFIETIVSAETEGFGLSKGRAFRYPAVSDIPEFGTERNSNTIVSSATGNAGFMIAYAGVESFLAGDARRKTRAIEHTIDVDDYVLKVRGGSGAGCFSLDLGLGFNSTTRYNELWRTGFDTEHLGDVMGARIIRTGSGVKPGDAAKIERFDQFRKDFGIMPQRLLGLASLYMMHEMKPDYMLALSTEGGKRLSTLGRSKGGCNYSGIFQNIGLRQSPDPYWLTGGAGPEAFYDTLERANISRREADTLDHVIGAINETMATHEEQGGTAMRLDLCSQQDPAMLEREFAIYMG